MQEQSIHEAFRTLQLPPDATLKEIRHSYRTLVRSWHPDRYSHDPQLQQAAQERLKEINAAYNLARKNILTPRSEIDSPFRFDLAAKHDGNVMPNGSAGEASADDSAKRRQPLPVTAPIKRPVMLNTLFILVFAAAAVLASRKHGASAEGVIHFLLVVTIPALCGFLCNSPLRTPQVKRGYLTAIVLAGTFLAVEAVSLRQNSDIPLIGPDTGTTLPYAGGSSPAGGSFGGDFTLGPPDRAGHPGLRQPSAPLSPSAPAVSAPASPDPPQAPIRR